MNFSQTYISKQRDFDPSVLFSPHPELGMIIVIPCLYEPTIISTLESILANQIIPGQVEILVVVNTPENSDNDITTINRQTYSKLKEWSKSINNQMLKFIHILKENLPQKHAGAGLARKIGMDIASYRFGLINRPRGIIVSLDADTLVKSNYIQVLMDRFTGKSSIDMATISFAHDIEGTSFSIDHYKAIQWYELHMRYYKSILFYTGYPFAIFSIGSAFALTAETYVQHGGMNKRKAGEDFYFLQKIRPNVKFTEIKETLVYPSSRFSDRVPFGTGPILKKIVDQGELKTYHPHAFLELKIFFSLLKKFHEAAPEKLYLFQQLLPNAIREFLIIEKWIEAVSEISKNCASYSSFEKRFFIWFNAFKILKFLNFAHDGFFEKMEIVEAANTWLTIIGNEKNTSLDAKKLLEYFRGL